MDSVDKLREFRNTPDFGYWADEITELADEIEREIAERYMKLPVDADGVPIRVGEEMTCHGDVFTVCAVAPAKIHRWATVKLGEPQTTYSYDPTECAHYKPRTLEDVLREFTDEVIEWSGYSGPVSNDTTWSGMSAKYAAEIRELMSKAGD